MSFIGPFVMTFFVVLFFLLMQFLWRYIDELVGKGLDLSIIGELLLYASAGLIPLALPLAILLSSLMTFGNMGEFYELTAIKASGISLQRILIPIAIIVIFITIGSFIFSNNVLPVTNLKMKSLISDVRRQRPEVSIIEGAFYNGIGNYTIRVGKKDPITNVLYDLKIYNHSNGKGNADVTIADSGRMKMTDDKRNMIFVLWHGYKYTESEENRRRRDRRYPHQLMKFIELSGFELSRSDEKIFKNAYQMLNVQQLKRASDSIKNELHDKIRSFNVIFTNKSLIQLGDRFRESSYHTDSHIFNNTRDLTRHNAIQQPAEKINSASTVPINRKMDVASRKAEAQRAARMQRADLEINNEDPSDSIALSIPKPVLPQLKKIENFDSLFASFGLREREELIKAAMGNISQNQYLIASISSFTNLETRLLRRHEIELHRKFTLSMACLIFLFIGAPLGAIIRKGGLGLPTVISTLMFILYYIISLTGEKFVRESILTAFQGMWLSSFVLIIAGIFLTYQATNDSAILNIDTYLNWIREKIGIRKGILLEQKAHITGKFDLIELPKEELQKKFKDISDLAVNCLTLLKKDANLPVLARKSFENKGFFYLIEFGIHYNSFIDQAILSKWFRIPYFKKRISEFPFITGKITSTIFTKRFLVWFAAIIFPIGLIRLFHIKLKVRRMMRNLMQVVELSAGMINLLNSSALKIDVDKV
jgi:lipopolysaccharide export system permease protein